MTEISVPLQTAKIGVDMSPEVAAYVGMLEGTIAALCINGCQNRALLELLTGDGWEASRVDMNGDALQAFSIDALVKQTGMDIAKAKLIVAKRWAERNHPADYVIPQAIPTSEYIAGPSPENPDKNPPASPSAMSSRLAEWQARQQTEAAEI